MLTLLTPDTDRSLHAELEAYAGAYPLTVLALLALLERQASYAVVVAGALRQPAQFWINSEDRCAEILYLVDGSRERFRRAVMEWVKFSIEYLRRQQKFLKTGHYGHSQFADVQDLYENDERMKGFYLIALMFSFVFSTNYAGFFEFFRRRLLPCVKGATQVSDVGCGHGVYLAQMLCAEPRALGHGIDISPASLATTARMLAYHEVFERSYRLLHGDVQRELPLPTGSQDAVTCFEVVEHLEDPGAAVKELRRVVKPGGVLCLSTAIRMESVDHLHLFRSPAEVQAMTMEAGFTTLDEECIPLTTEDFRDPAVRARLVNDPATAVGYVALLR